MNSESNITTPHLPIELAENMRFERKGKSILKFFGMSVYEARLWAPIELTPHNYHEHNFALELIYQRPLQGSLIAEITLAQMQKLDTLQSINPSLAAHYLQRLEEVFVDVKPNDRMTGINIVRAGVRQVQIYFNGQLRGVIEDPIFATLFFDIWLHAKSSNPQMRSDLFDFQMAKGGS